MLKVGIFFGGPAREREISFAGGKTAYENIDKTLFEPVPVFIDKAGNFILVNTDILYQSSIREFYPPKDILPTQEYPFSVYVESLGEISDKEQDDMIARIGKRVYPHQFKEHFQFAFVAMHGPACEDGSIQGLLEWYGIPYSGPGLMGSAIGIDKIAQNELLRLSVGLNKKTATLSKDDWNSFGHITLFEQIKNEVGLPFVVKAPHQGSSIGVSFVKIDDLEVFEKAIEQCLFIKRLSQNDWRTMSHEQQGDYLQRLANLDEGIGFPLVFNNREIVYHPQQLWSKLEVYFSGHFAEAIFSSIDSEDAVLIEGFVKGQEFSCGVIQDLEGAAVALPPTEIVKVSADVEVFDFNSKYKPGATRKRLPIDTTLQNLENVQTMVREAFEKLRFGVCTRIDGFLTEDDEVILHDPNTIPGMSPTSLIFKQMAEIGFTVADAITYFIRNSIRERIRTGKNTFVLGKMLEDLDEAITNRTETMVARPRVAVVFGNSTDPDASYAQARKVFGKLAASKEYFPVPILVKDDKMYQLPLNLMFKDYIEDLWAVIDQPIHPLIIQTRRNASYITKHFVGDFEQEIKLTNSQAIEKNCNLIWNSATNIDVNLPKYES
jgi:D-alanine-D-alanine ligase